ncbi:hypothetical protein [Parasphingorhabdus sp.]|jgi:hypothetical protein|uniref:hypothetical protein n=1 Tax=Parasphingorhabdus sp. TaxID=2709688 RepID=UPI0039E3E27D
MTFVKLFAATTMVALASLAVPSVAKPVEEKNLVSGKFSFDETKGYIYLHGPGRQNGIFLRLPDEEDKTAYQKEWVEELAKAQEKYAKKLTRWEREVAVVQQTGKNPSAKPIEPTAENYSIGAIELRGQVSFGPMFVFAKDGEGDSRKYAYMEEVEPGDYVYYGPVFANPNGGYFGTCFCMGSVQFSVKPGVVTNIGNFLFAAPDYDSVTTKISDISAQQATSVLTSEAVDMNLPASLQAVATEQADFRASGKMDNYYGVTIDRIPAIDGIIAYERDVVVDLKQPIADNQSPRIADNPGGAETIEADENLPVETNP